MYKYIIMLFLVFSTTCGFAQSYEKEFETLFAWEVKQMDEFIERFNNNDKTLLKLYNQKLDPSVQFTREKMIKGLFNTENKSWNFTDIQNFINAVTDKQNPYYLKFYGDNWWAIVNCKVTWKGKPEDAILTLQIQKQPNGGSKWVITGVNAKFLHQQRLADSVAGKPYPKLPEPKDATVSLNPSSHSTDFMNIDQVSRNKANTGSYFIHRSSYYDELPLFANEIAKSQLLINRVSAISYRFTHVAGWSFDVQQYNRQTKNSGWLINKLSKTIN
jgi:hypothetical protein